MVIRVFDENWLTETHTQASYQGPKWKHWREDGREYSAKNEYRRAAEKARPEMVRYTEQELEQLKWEMQGLK